MRKSKEVFAGDERILGSSAFVASVLGQANEDYKKKAIAALHGIDMVRLAAIVCDCFGLNPVILKSPSKQSHISRVRGIISHIAFDILRLRGVDIAKQLNVTPAAVSKLVAKGRADPSSEGIKKILYEKQ